MISNETLADGLKKEYVRYSALMSDTLAEIQSIRKDIARRRKSGEKVKARIDRKLEEIQTTIDDVHRAR
jgi:hypothetical protein